MYCDTRKPINLMLVLLACAVVVVLVTLNNHALERHGDKAQLVQTCIDSGNSPVIKLENKETNRIGYICQIEPNLFGIYITTSDGVPITAFIKDKMKLMSDVLRYMANRGYLP